MAYESKRYGLGFPGAVILIVVYSSRCVPRALVAIILAFFNLQLLAHEDSLFTMRGEFMRAAKILRLPRPKIEELFEKFTPPPQTEGDESQRVELPHTFSAPSALSHSYSAPGGPRDPPQAVTEEQFLATMLGNTYLSDQSAAAAAATAAATVAAQPGDFQSALFGEPAGFSSGYHAPGYGSAFPSMSMSFPSDTDGGALGSN
jgi:hypothetical protein